MLSGHPLKSISFILPNKLPKVSFKDYVDRKRWVGGRYLQLQLNDFIFHGIVLAIGLTISIIVFAFELIVVLYC